jgi:hypothetical protein
LKTFDSFPEGVVLLRGEEVVYKNSALRKALNISSKEGNILKALRETKIRRYTRAGFKESNRNKHDK